MAAKTKKPDQPKATTTPAEEQKSRQDADRGAPVEHYHGEPDTGRTTGSEGSLEKETLDPAAPYNKTYGR